ncbi:MAG: hypothetical protein Q9220_004468 [cf. Caloplaca sp. 1 TL-2023]
MEDTVMTDVDNDLASFISDDSSFYGSSAPRDDETRAKLEQRAQEYDPAPYWAHHEHLLPVIIAKARAKAQAQASSASLAPERPLYNPYGGQTSGRQLNESVEQFLQRLPPLTTPTSAACSWIYVANPHATSRPTDADKAGFMQEGERLLGEFSEKQDEIETFMAGKAKGTITRKLTPLRKALEEGLLGKAKEKGFTSGKWMLFPFPDDVNRQWGIVAEATVNRELGFAAKVAPDGGKGDQEARLICVYTKDFSDLDDVKRVLGKLVELGLAKKKSLVGEEKMIWYKADAFTELGITSGNDWGLKPSLYASNHFWGNDGKKKK